MTTQAAFGTIEITRHYYDPEADPRCESPWITIDAADPRILISHELLEQIGRGECVPNARLDKTCACSPEEVRVMCPHYQGARLEINARNTRLVYVIGALDPASWPYWPAGWPD